MNEVLLVFGMMLVTFGVRYPVLALVGRVNLPDPVLRALKYVPPAVLTAIIVPATFMPQGDFNPGLDNAYIIGFLAAVGVSWRTRSLLWTIITSMAVFFMWRALTGAVS